MHRSHARGFLATFVDSGGRRATGSLWQRTWAEQQSKVDRHLSACWGLPFVLQPGQPNLMDDICKGVSQNQLHQELHLIHSTNLVILNLLLI